MNVRPSNPRWIECLQFRQPGSPPNVQVQRAAAKSLQVVKKSGYRRFVATVGSPLREVVHWHPPEPSGSRTIVPRIQVGGKFFGHRHRLAIPSTHLSIESECPQTAQSAFSRQRKSKTLNADARQDQNPSHRHESGARLRRNLRPRYWRTVTITGFGWAERRRVKWRSQPAVAETIQTPVHRFVMRCHNCEHTRTMNDRTIRSAPIVADQTDPVKHGPDFGRPLISGHDGRVPSLAQCVRAIEHDFHGMRPENI